MCKRRQLDEQQEDPRTSFMAWNCKRNCDERPPYQSEVFFGLCPCRLNTIIIILKTVKIVKGQYDFEVHVIGCFYLKPKYQYRHSSCVLRAQSQDVAKTAMKLLGALGIQEAHVAEGRASESEASPSPSREAHHS